MIYNISKNKYDLIIIILLASMALGNIGGALQISRLIAIFYFPLLLKRIKFSLFYVRKYLIFIVFFMLYSLCSLLWSPDTSKGLEEFIYFIVHWLIFLEILVFSRLAVDPIRSIAVGWLSAIVLTLFCAVWELLTDNHLALSIQEADLQMNTGMQIIQRRFASVTFGNYNSYVTFLCLSLPFVFWLIGNMRNKVNNIFIICIIVTVFIVILFNASRGGLMCMLIMFAFYFMLLDNPKFKIVLFVFAGIFMLLAFNLFGESLLVTIIARSSDGGLLEGSSRFEIWSNAYRVFINTLGFGTGIGGVELSMGKVTNDILVPHNMVIEIFVEFGLIMGLCFLFFIFEMLKSGHKSRGSRKCVLYLAFISLPFTLIINSRYLLYSFVFAYFASIIIYSRYEFIKSRLTKQ